MAWKGRVVPKLTAKDGELRCELTVHPHERRAYEMAKTMKVRDVAKALGRPEATVQNWIAKVREADRNARLASNAAGGLP